MPARLADARPEDLRAVSFGWVSFGWVSFGWVSFGWERVFACRAARGGKSPTRSRGARLAWHHGARFQQQGADLAGGGGELQSTADVEIDGVQFGERRRDSTPAQGFRQGPEPQRARLRLDDQHSLGRQAEAGEARGVEVGSARRDPDDRPGAAEEGKQAGGKAERGAVIGRAGDFMHACGRQAATEQAVDGIEASRQPGRGRGRLRRPGLDGADPTDQL